MKYNLDRQIRLETSPKHKGLYSWALQETDSEGSPIGRDQIPWTFSHSFIATELTVHESSAAGAELEKARTWILAKLKPQGNRYRRPTYSMFGTDRTIDSIQLFIQPIDDDAEQPHNAVRASGFVSYTSDDPLWGGTEVDHLQFDLSLKREEFDHIANRIAAQQVDTAVFRFHAEGFYSEWTPDIETDKFKVLSSHEKEQSIVLPSDCSIEPPRLGEIRDASFSIQKIIQPRVVIDADAREEAEDDDDGWANTPVVNQTPEPRWVKPFYSELKTVKALLAAVVGILALGLFFN